MQTDKGGQQGPRSTRDGPSATGQGQGQGQRYRQPDHNDRDTSNIGVSPAVPGFGFQFPTMPNGAPMFPPGFVMPTVNPTQPPPPGAG